MAFSFQADANVEALRNLFEDVHAFQIELEIENVGFRENQSTVVGIKHSEKRLEPNKPNSPHIWQLHRDLIEPGRPHGCEASALTHSAASLVYTQSVVPLQRWIQERGLGPPGSP